MLDQEASDFLNNNEITKNPIEDQNKETVVVDTTFFLSSSVL
jgi:hypothetical protein